MRHTLYNILLGRLDSSPTVWHVISLQKLHHVEKRVNHFCYNNEQVEHCVILQIQSDQSLAHSKHTHRPTFILRLCVSESCWPISVLWSVSQRGSQVNPDDLILYLLKLRVWSLPRPDSEIQSSILLSEPASYNIPLCFCSHLNPCTFGNVHFFPHYLLLDC